MYELIILSLLMRGPSHGYLISKIINDIFGPYTKISNGRLYPLLAKLQSEGLIEIVTEPLDVTLISKGERHTRSYLITTAGRRRFHVLMMDTTSNPGEYQRLFWHKANMLEYMQPSERLYLVEHYINYCQAHILHLIAESEDLAQLDHDLIRPSTQHAVLNTMQHMIDVWHLEVSWAQKLHEEVVTELKLQEDVVGKTGPA
jgi:DNA-binding PadR family transcriptional regulator